MTKQNNYKNTYVEYFTADTILFTVSSPLIITFDVYYIISDIVKN